jgi:bla regulator protein blaR1
MALAAMHAGVKFLALILDAAFRSLLLACFLAAVLAAFRARAVRAKLLAWRGLLLVAIGMPLLMLLSPAVPVAVPVLSFSRDGVTAAAHAADRAPASPAAMKRPLEGDRSERASQAMAAPALPSRTQPTVSSFAPPEATQAISWPLIAVAVYLGIALVFFARLLIGIHFSKRLVSGADAIEEAHALRLLASASGAAGLREVPRLAESEMVSVPVTLGVRRPMILLPTSWRDWEGDELAAVLAHEVSHVARRDSLVQLLALIHRAIFWFSPLSWWLERHLADLAEQASDEAVLAGGVDRARYARALLGFLADLESSPARVWWHGVAMAKSGQGEKRVERILEWRSTMSHSFSKPLSIALLAVCLPAVAVTVTAHPSAYQLQEAAVPAPATPAAPPPPNQLAPPVAIPVPPAAPIAIPAGPTAAPAPPQAAQPALAPPVPADPAVAVPVQPLAAQVPSQSEALPTPPPPPPPAPIAPPAGDWSGFGPSGWGPQFVIITKGSDVLVLNGSEEDAEHARALGTKIPGDFIWFEHDGKSYIIRDQAIVDRAKQIWAQRGDSAKLQQELQAKQRELSKEMHEQVQERMEEIRVKIPDMTDELQKLQSEIKEFNARGATLQQLGDLQREVGGLQQELGEARWNSNMRDINRQAAKLGRQLGDLGRQMGEIARREVEQGRQAGEQMRQLFDDAIARGIAKPE